MGKEGRKKVGGRGWRRTGEGLGLKGKRRKVGGEEGWGAEG